MDKEYAFSTKALTKEYLKRKLTTWLTPGKENLLVREIAYARLKHPLLFCDIMGENPDIQTDISIQPAIIERGQIDTPFKNFVESGCSIKGEFQVNSYTTNDQNNPSTAMDSSGNFVVA